MPENTFNLPADLSAVYDLMKRAAVVAGAAVMRIYNSPESDWEVERKADNSPLTLADREANRLICELLEPLGLPVISEERAAAGYEARKGWGACFIVDPLDGTKEFLKRNGEFTVNIALVAEGVPVAGAVGVPALGRLYFGEAPLGGGRGRACRFDGVTADGLAEVAPQALPLKAREAGAPLRVVASRSHLSAETAAYIDSLRARHGAVETVSAGSSLKLCLVAEGTADVYPRFAPTMEWDTAAAHAVVRAAGGTVATADTGCELTYNKPDLHNPWFVVRGAR